MANVKLDIRMRLLSPLAHFGDERMGTMQLMRTTKIRHNGEFIDIPVYSGNAFRGILRRRIMRDYLERIDIADEQISKNLYYMLFTGGALTSGSRYEEVGDRRKMRKMCPPLALLGTAIGSQIPQGKMKSPLFMPVCKETEEYTGIKEDLSFYDMLEEVFYTRRDDLKSIESIVADDEKKDEKANPTQMKYEMQCLSTGTVLIGTLVVERATKVEEACLHQGLKLIEEIPYIGGKSSAGHGEIAINYGELEPVDTYFEYLKEYKKDMRGWVREIEGSLK